MSDLRDRAVRGLAAGDVLAVTRRFTAADVDGFGALTRDRNPVHSEPSFTAAKGFAGPICHGLLVGSMVTEIGGEVAWLATEMTFRFRRPVYPGDVITCTLTILEVDEKQRATARAVLTNQDGIEVVEATLTGRLPTSAERVLLAELSGAAER
ncbi:MAG TPA: MaoC family dehydratase [Polyangia bacterium]|jgi:acyl dehydratase